MPTFDYDAVFDMVVGEVADFPPSSSFPGTGADSWAACKRLLSPLFVAHHVREWPGSPVDFCRGLVVFKDHNVGSFALTECGRYVVKSMLQHALSPDRPGTAYEEVITTFEIPMRVDPSVLVDRGAAPNGDWLCPAWPVVYDVDSGVVDSAYDTRREACLVGFAPDRDSALHAQQLPGMRDFDTVVGMWPDERYRRRVMRHAIMVVHCLCKAFMSVGCELLEQMIRAQYSDFFALLSSIGPVPYHGVDLFRDSDSNNVFADATVRARMWHGHDRRSRGVARSIARLRHAVHRCSKVYDTRSNRVLCTSYRVISPVVCRDPVIAAVVSVWVGGRVTPDVLLSQYGALAAANLFRARECLVYNASTGAYSNRDMMCVRSRIMCAVVSYVDGHDDVNRMWVHGMSVDSDSDDDSE